MISIKDVTILDILPYTFKTAEYEALSRAIASLTALFYETMSSVLFWADIENASPALLDAMAAELDAPFYLSDMPIEQKRSIIAAAFVYNSHIGTVSSVQELVAAAFGGGNIAEWYEYGGDPYYFKVEIDGDITKPGMTEFKYFSSMLNKVKNVRAKLDELTVVLSLPQSAIYYAGIVSRIEDSMVVTVDMSGGGDTLGVENVGVFMCDAESGRSYLAQEYNTYEDIKNMTYEETSGKTYAELLYKED